MFCTVIARFEIFNTGLHTTIDSLWYIFITVSTIGYGDFYAQSFIGQISMVIATFFGILLNSIFVVCTDNLLQMDLTQKCAFRLMRRCHLKREMMNYSIGFLIAMYKIKIIFREKAKQRDRNYRDYDLFYWQK